MIALISPAKTMQSTASIPNDELTEPRFLEQVNYILSLMSQYSSAELGEIFKISPSIARELKKRFENHLFNSNSTLAAIDSYDGVVYKHIKNKGAFTSAQKEYLQNHLCISSILYGLLRPLDRIMPYRMEGFVRLAGSDQRIDVFWRAVQTKTLIDDINRAGGTLLYLASKEEQNAFHWKQVRESVRVIDFQFLQHKGDKLRQVVVYTKMARGEMVRYMVENHIDNPEELKAFEWGGYRYNDTLSSADVWVWVLE